MACKVQTAMLVKTMNHITVWSGAGQLHRNEPCSQSAAGTTTCMLVKRCLAKPNSMPTMPTCTQHLGASSSPSEQHTPVACLMGKRVALVAVRHGGPAGLATLAAGSNKWDGTPLAVRLAWEHGQQPDLTASPQAGTLCRATMQAARWQVYRAT